VSYANAAAELDPDEREALAELCFRLADDEFVTAERYTEWQIFAPTLESDLALANVAQDELGHARLWFELLGDFGYAETDLVWERPADEWTHATLTELPYAEGDWADVVVRSYLYDVAERLRLEALVDTAYPPLADRVGKVLSEEEYHREHAANWLDRLAGADGGHRRLQTAVDRLFPHALSLFAPGDHEDAIVEHGFRTESLADLRAEWLDLVVPTLEGYDLTVPDPEAAERPDAVGRDGSHTDAWTDLYEEFTRTYDELDRPSPVTLRSEEFQA